MPMLPSGRHVAMIRTPLQDLLEDATNILKVHKVLAIQQKVDIYPFTEVLWLVPEDQATRDQLDAAFLDGSLPRPPGLIPVRSGYRISQFETFAADWSGDDKAAFWEFIYGRADALFEQSLQMVLEVQTILRTKADGMAKLMVLWWDQGVHPAQEGYSTEEGEQPIWDTYDMLAALGHMVEKLSMIELEDKLLEDRMRLAAMWSVYGQHVSQLTGWPGLETTPRAAAQMARNEKWLDAMDTAAQATLHRQCVHECVMLWDHLGDELCLVYPDPGKIIELVVMSPDANEVFNP